MRAACGWGLICNERQTDRELDLAEALAARLNSKLIHFVPRDNIVQHAELRKMTVIQYAPNSKQAGEYRALAEKIHANSGRGTVPTPITMEELEDMLLDFGIMKSDEQMLAELHAKEAKVIAPTESPPRGWRSWTRRAIPQTAPLMRCHLDREMGRPK